jgi:putative MFS transporter
MATIDRSELRGPAGGTASPPGEAGALIARLERLPFTRMHLGVAGMLGAGTLLDAFDSLIIASAAVVIATTMHLGLASVGVLISAAYLGQFVGALAFGGLSEMVGRRPAFIGALLIFGGLSLVTAAAWNYQSLLVLRFLQGIGLGAEVPIAGALFNELVRGRTRGRVVLLYESVYPWGILLAPLVAAGLYALVGQALGWRLLFVLGGLALVPAVVAWFALPESPRWLVEHGHPESAERVVRRLEASARRRQELPPVGPVALPSPRPTRFGELLAPPYRRRTLVSWTQWFTAYFVTYGLTTWLPTLYVRIGGLPVTSSLLLTSLSSLVGNLPIAYLFALTADRVGRKPFFVGGFALAVLGAAFGLAVVVAGGHPHWPVLFASGLAMQVGVGCSSLGVYLYTPELFPTRMRAWATATGSSWNRIGAFIAPSVIGVLLGSGLGIGGVFAMFGVVAAAGGVVLARWGLETRRRTLEELSR